MDLQLFAEERTEEASPRKLQKARQEGRAPRSADLMAGVGLVAATMAIQFFGPTMYESLAGAVVKALSQMGTTDLTPETFGTLAQDVGLLFIRSVLPLVGVLVVVGLMTGLLQTGFLFSTKPLAPDFERINPLAGLARLFSLRTLVEAIKTFLKLAMIGYIAYRDVATALPELVTLIGKAPAVGITRVVALAVTGLQHIGFGLLALGVADYAYQYWEFRKSLRMSKQEVKQEHKEQEGSPEVRQRQRQKQRELARRRKALKDVPTADVVITNPTHFGIAIKYEADKDSVPRVIAKGADLLAQRMKVIAKQHDVPMVENRPLARSLFAVVEVGKTIPPDLYQAVAEVLAFVYSVRRQKRYRDNPVQANER